VRQALLNKLSSRTFGGHPAGLYVLFFTEMWERFSYYGMRALLVLYMTSYLLFEPERAAEVLGYNGLESWLISVFGEMNVQQISSQIYGLYTGFIYFTPLFGGMLADRLGQYKTVVTGGILMAIGHFLMASEQLFLVALVFLVLGNGCFKPNISTQVGTLYPDGDPRRDRAYTIFYMGINLGAFFSPLVCGTLGQKVGWHWGFGAAGVGMVIGVLVYLFGAPLLPNTTIKPAKRDKTEPAAKLTSTEWKAVAALILLSFMNIVFWAVYEQQGNTLQLWADQRTDWHFFGIEIPSTWFQSFNPLFIFLFAPVLNMVWAWQNRKGGEPSSITKMGIGCFLVGGAYVLMYLAALAVPEDQRGSVMWLVGTVFIFTMGELYLSPIGLSLVSKVAPKRLVGTMMGFWFLSSFFGNYLTGYLGTFYSKMPKEQFFMMLFGLGVAAGAIFFLLRRPLTKAIGNKV
jgi:POT family proton-dependent oligopeptide transporter